ncbi:MAG: glycosyltransferase family 2 protein [Candidatus Fermentibacter sp.]|nr:glycosyltransferase family 2 protein [Candidatus Fermentibacter sp.]
MAGAPVSVIIPNYDGDAMLARCLDSLLSQAPAPGEIIVVDNGSKDGSRETLRRSYPSVKLIELESNFGFAKACNVGAASAAAPLLAFVNNDCIALPGWLDALIGAMEDPGGRVGAVSSSMRNARNAALIDSAGGEIDHLGFMRDRGAGRSAAPYSSREEIPFPCGGACLVRRSALADGGSVFWETLESYVEDVDLGFRLFAAGWRTLFEPSAVVLHEHSATGSRDPLGKETRCVRNRLLVLRRHLPAATFRSLLPVILAAQAAWAVSALSSARIVQLRALCRGTLDGLTMRICRYPAPRGHLLMARFAIPSEGGPLRRAASRAASEVVRRAAMRNGE